MQFTLEQRQRIDALKAQGSQPSGFTPEQRTRIDALKSANQIPIATPAQEAPRPTGLKAMMAGISAGQGDSPDMGNPVTEKPQGMSTNEKASLLGINLPKKPEGIIENVASARNKAIVGVGKVAEGAHNLLFGGAKVVGKAIQSVPVTAKANKELDKSRELLRGRLDDVMGSDLPASKKRAAANILRDGMNDQIKSFDDLVDAPTIGQVAGASAEIFLDVATAGIGAGAKNSIKLGYKLALKEGGESGAKQYVKQVAKVLSSNKTKAIAGGAALGGAYGATGNLQEGYTSWIGMAKDVVAGGTIGAALPVAGLAGGGLYKAAQKIIMPIDANKVVDEYFEKAIVPQFRGATKTPAGRKKYNEKSKDAVKLITANKENIQLTDDLGDAVDNQLPQTLKQMEQGLSQTKQSVFKEYSALSEKNGAIKLDIDEIKINLTSFITNKKFALSPKIKKAAADFIEQLDELDSLDVLEAEDILKQLNAELATFYNKQGGDADVAIVKHIMANNIREQMDKSISGASGEYSGLKKAYGALSTIEKDVTHRALVEGRKAPNGFFELADVYNAGQLASGVATGNPASMIQGIAGVAAKKRIKTMNDKNRMVKKMFEGVDKATVPRTKQAQQVVPPKSQSIESSKDIIPKSVDEVNKGEKLLYEREAINYLEAIGSGNKAKLKQEFLDSGDSIDDFIIKKEAFIEKQSQDITVKTDTLDVDVESFVSDSTKGGVLGFVRKYSGGEFKGKTSLEARDFLEKKDSDFFMKNGLGIDEAGRGDIYDNEGVFDLIKDKFLKEKSKSNSTKAKPSAKVGGMNNLETEAKKFGGVSSTNANTIKVYHGAGNDADFTAIKSGDFDTMLNSSKKEASTGGNRLGLSTSTNIDMAKDFAFSSGGRNLIEFDIAPNAKILDLKGKSLDDLTESDMRVINKNFDVVRDLDDVGGEGEIRILNKNVIIKEVEIDDELFTEAVDSIADAKKFGDDLDSAFEDFADGVLTRGESSYDELRDIWNKANKK